MKNNTVYTAHAMDVLAPLFGSRGGVRRMDRLTTRHGKALHVLATSRRPLTFNGTSALCSRAAVPCNLLQSEGACTVKPLKPLDMT
jgi:hypothetical protein